MGFMVQIEVSFEPFRGFVVKAGVVELVFKASRIMWVNICYVSLCMLFYRKQFCYNYNDNN